MGVAPADPVPAEAHRAYLTRARFGALDGLRALAIGAVLVHHSALARPEGPWSRGFLGVDLFFKISFIMLFRRKLNQDLSDNRGGFPNL